MGDVIKQVGQASISGVALTVASGPYSFQHRREEPPVNVPNLGITGVLDIRFDDTTYYTT